MPENPTEPIDWASYHDAVTENLIARIAEERGYRTDFVRALHRTGFFGLCPQGRYEGWTAFPVHDTTGEVVAAHLVKPDEKVFVYEPRGTGVKPLVVGELANARTISVFEGQWDMFAVMDRLEADPDGLTAGSVFVSTRGATNVAGLADRLPPGATVIAWTQNDEDGKRWQNNLETLCLTGGLRFGVLSPPSGYKDFNDLFRNDSAAVAYRRVTLEGLIEQAVQTASAIVGGEGSDDGNVPEEEVDAPLPPFPLHTLPLAARVIIERGAAVLQVPPVLMAVCVLGALSTAVGVGIAVLDGLGRKAYGNVYIVAAASPGAGKTQAAGLIYQVIRDLENELLDAHTRDVMPRASARKAKLTAKSKKLARAAERVVSEDEDNLDTTEVELSEVYAALEEIEKTLVEPKLIVGDATTEALGALLAKRRCLTSFSSDARDEMSTLLGRYRDRGQTDEGLYLKMWSGDSYQVDRIGRASLRLVNARLSLLWLVQPDKLRELVAAEGLWEGGLLPRLLLVQTGAEMQRIDPDNTVTLPPAVIADWAALVRPILERYRLAEAEREAVQPTPEAIRILTAVHNRGYEFVHSGVLRDVDSFVARWAEQAWRIALILHVADHPSDAEAHPLAVETASAAGEIADWFCQHQLRLLARGREERRTKNFERLVETLERANGEETVRNLRDRHGWDERELTTLVAAYPTQIAFVEQPSGPRGGRPSHRVKLLQ